MSEWDHNNSRAAKSQNNAVQLEPSGLSERDHSNSRAAQTQKCAIQAEPNGVSEWDHGNCRAAQSQNGAIQAEQSGALEWNHSESREAQTHKCTIRTEPNDGTRATVVRPNPKTMPLRRSHPVRVNVNTARFGRLKDKHVQFRQSQPVCPNGTIATAWVLKQLIRFL